MDLNNQSKIDAFDLLVNDGNDIDNLSLTETYIVQANHEEAPIVPHAIVLETVENEKLNHQSKIDAFDLMVNDSNDIDNLSLTETDVVQANHEEAPIVPLAIVLETGATRDVVVVKASEEAPMVPHAIELETGITRDVVREAKEKVDHDKSDAVAMFDEADMKGTDVDELSLSSHVPEEGPIVPLAIVLETGATRDVVVVKASEEAPMVPHAIELETGITRDVVREAKEKVDHDKSDATDDTSNEKCPTLSNINALVTYEIFYKTLDKGNLNLKIGRAHMSPNKHEIIEFIKQIYPGLSMFKNESKKNAMMVLGYMDNTICPINIIQPKDFLFFIKDDTLFFDYDIIYDQLKSNIRPITLAILRPSGSINTDIVKNLLNIDVNEITTLDKIYDYIPRSLDSYQAIIPTNLPPKTDKRAFVCKGLTQINKTNFPRVVTDESRSPFSMVSLDQKSIGHVRDIFFGDMHLSEKVKSVQSEIEPTIIKFSSIKDERIQIRFFEGSDVAKSVTELMYEAGIVEKEYEIIDDISLIIGGSKIQAIHGDHARLFAYIDDKNLCHEINRDNYNKAVSSKYAPSSVLLDLSHDESGFYLAIPSFAYESHDSTNTVTIGFSDLPSPLLVKKEFRKDKNGIISVMIKQGCQFVGDFFHGGGNNVSKLNKHDKQKFTKMFQNIDKLPRPDGKIIDCEQVLTELNGFVNLSTVSRLFFKTFPRSYCHQIPRNIVYFPAPGDTKTCEYVDMRSFSAKTIQQNETEEHEKKTKNGPTIIANEEATNNNIRNESTKYNCNKSYFKICNNKYY